MIESIERLRQLQQSALAWLLERIDDDGRPVRADEHNGYYRLPWVLAYTGHRDVADRVMWWMDRNTLTESGDLREGPAREAFTTSAASYPLSIIAQGAHLLERYDVSSRVLDTLRDFQDPQSGGAYTARKGQGSSLQLAYLTAQLGMTSLAAGRIEVADAAYRWFERFFDAQPDLPNCLYLGWDDTGLVTEIPTDGGYSLLINFNQPRQAFHTPGISAAFLARYSMQAGTKAAGEMARALLRLHDTATDEQFNHWESSAVCKLGLGAAALNELSPSPEYVGILQRMTDWYTDAQEPAGNWVHRAVTRPNPTEAHLMEKTAENLLWVSMMLTSLAGTRADLSVA
ncbi:hypothetical protein [Arthrobacter sp. EPSL27]|uniref:hypothetical protein n=1 Tax=Arthrobacter sp. EPSL27 TaxID=1745378 RepID=UPI0007492A33|nr:hypothetical protein [Arthrobacter sp. EPSL27]KUM37401.1 hypothetical protein AR539_09055 [Arthrobacter sp. EPSL27]